MLHEHAVPQDYNEAFASHGSDAQGVIDEHGQMQGRENESDLGRYNTSKSCTSGGECEPCEQGKKKLYNPLQRFPAYLCRHVRYRHTNWISTRELARKLDQLEQFTHHHALEDEITERHFMVLDARSDCDYRKGHIHGAIHLPASAHLCSFVRPGFHHVQKHLFDPPRNTPLTMSKDKPILKLLQTLDKDIEIVVYCAVGHRSGWIASALGTQGYNVSAVYGGMYKWVNEGREVFEFKSEHPDPDETGKKETLLAKIGRLSHPKSKSKKMQKKQKKNTSPRGSMSDSQQDLMHARAGVSRQPSPSDLNDARYVRAAISRQPSPSDMTDTRNARVGVSRQPSPTDATDARAARAADLVTLSRQPSPTDFAEARHVRPVDLVNVHHISAVDRSGRAVDPTDSQGMQVDQRELSKFDAYPLPIRPSPIQ